MFIEVIRLIWCLGTRLRDVEGMVGRQAAKGGVTLIAVNRTLIDR